MQREILFKAKRKDDNEWVYGYLIIDKVGCSDNETGKDIYYIAGNSDMYVEVISETICQYTGLNDKNGKKIFENDILQGFEEYYDEFVKGMVDLDLYNGIQLVIKENSCHFDYIYDYEVIGNAFDEEVK